MGVNVSLLTEMGVNLTTLAVKGTVAAATTKIRAIKTEKDIEMVRNTYDELINELLSEREEAIRIAQVYKWELEKIEISDKDIEHLHNTVTGVLAILRVMSPDAPLESFAQIQKLISVDTLKTMQLLGFNYKAAIGEPLTELCADFILQKTKSRSSKNNASNRKRN